MRALLIPLLCLSACKKDDPTPGTSPVGPGPADCGEPLGLPDADADGVRDPCDLCEGDDAFGDSDADGTCDDIDPCPTSEDDDTDGDGVCDRADLCPGSDDQVDADGDGFPCAADCDDGDASVFPTAVWYQDADGDGFGDPDTATIRCEAPEGYIAQSFDCDDTRADVRPEQDEWCDGVDTDCNPTTTEPDGVVHHWTAADGWRDITADLGSGAVWVSDGDGTLGLCGVTLTQTFEVHHDLVVAGDEAVLLGMDSPSFVVGSAGAIEPGAHLDLSGVEFVGGLGLEVYGADAEVSDSSFTGMDGAAEGVVVQAVDSHVVLQNVDATGTGRALAFTRGSAELHTVTLEGFSTLGDGGTLRSGGSAVDLDDVLILDSHADGSGGALSVSFGSLTASGLTLIDSSAGGIGGGLLAGNVALDLSGVEIEGSVASHGGGAYVHNSRGHFTYSTLMDNDALHDGGGLLVDAVQLDLSGTTLLQNELPTSGASSQEPGYGAGLWASRSVLHGRTLTLQLNRAHNLYVYGGALYARDSLLAFDDLQILANTAEYGSAMYLENSSASLGRPCAMVANHEVSAFSNTTYRPTLVELTTGSSLTVEDCDVGRDPALANLTEALISMNGTSRDADFPTPTPEDPFRCEGLQCLVGVGDDTDGDGLPDNLDRCEADDLADDDLDGVDCTYDPVDWEGTCPTGEADVGGVCVADSTLAEGLTGPEPSSCAELLAANPGLPDGTYRLVVGGVTTLASCDMTTDGGGWTLVVNYAHDPAQTDVPQTRADQLPLRAELPNAPAWPTRAWGHAPTDMRAGLGATELRFHGWREGVDPRTMHFVIASSTALDYANTGVGYLDVSDHRLMPDHDAALPASAEFYTFDAGDAALIESPFFSSTASWYVGLAFHLDDIEVPTPHRTVHQVWMR